MAKPLDPYHAKRDFQKTPEPKGKAARRRGDSFVIQKHDATRLHYDLRLEMDGVLKSWAVTKGPSLVPGEKRLAVHVEDHPLDYGAFEGTIPAGQYGGGTVLLWDRGTWEPEFDPHKGYAKGHLNFRLDGEKLGGSWHLVRMRARAKERQEQWLLIKSEDDFARTPEAPDILDEAPLSIATGRTLDEIAAGADTPARKSASAKPRSTAAPEPGSKKRPAHRADPAPGAVAGKELRPATSTQPTAGRAKMPEVVEPCLATLVSEAPQGAKWLHEIKWDGYRLIAFVDRRKVRLQTRRGHDWTARFPAIARTLRVLDVASAILDGEAVVADENGHSSFSSLQQALSDGGDAEAAIFYAFDLLHLDGVDWRGRRLEERKAQLSTLIAADRRDALRLSDHVDDDGPAMVRHACRLGMEGIISKRRDLPYRSGRNGDWTKSKCTERQEFVIAGFAPSTALKNAVGSLVLGYHEDGRLRHAGRTGTGFTADLARDLHKRLNPLRQKAPPFPEKLTALQRREAVWVEPTLVGEVEFRGWTADEHVRHAAFKGLRDDKAAGEVVRERAKDVATSKPGKSAAKTVAKPAAKAGKAASYGTTEVAGVPLTHPDRVLWEEQGITKQGLAEFYEEIAGWVLPHIANRPLALVRCPSGSQKGCFFQKHAWAGLTDFIRRDMVREENGEEEEVLFIEDIKGVVSLVQAGVLEIHPWGAPIDDVERPDRVILDLDPGDGLEWPQVIEGAQEARGRLEAMKLTSFVKTTGGKGLHVVVPLTPKAGWDEVKAFAKSMADQMAADRPERYTATSVKRERQGRIYVDYLRNGRGATAVAPYSTRARPGAPIAVPIAWEELSPALKPNQFTVGNLPARLARMKRDPWKDIAEVKQVLPEATGTPRGKSRRS